MKRRDAIQLLHERHPHVIDEPSSQVDHEAFCLDLFWFQGHVCDLIDERAASGLRRCFETAHRLMLEGGPKIREALCEHFVMPHLVFHRDLSWAKGCMPPFLAEVCDKARELVEKQTGPNPGKE